MAGALDGVRVIDLTAMFAGPLATMMLADQGADVVKVEPPGSGDLMRRMGVMRGGLAATFHAVNRNKRSLVLDLRTPRGVDLLKRLVAGADVFVQSFRPGVVERLGIDEPALRRVREDLVYVSLSAWGERGPLAQRPAFDSIVQAVSGFADSQAEPDGVPRLVRNAVTDKVTGLTAAQAITAALFARERGAGGQHVRLAMLDAALAFLWIDVMQHRCFVGHESTRRNAWPYVLPTRDGFVMLSLIDDRMFEAAARALGADALRDDPRFRGVEARLTHLDALSDELAARTARLDTDTLCARLESLDVPHAPVTRLAELEAHPQVRANATLVEAEHPRSGVVRQPRPAARFDATPAQLRRPAPLLGEHADELLREIGVAAAEIARLRADGVVG